MKDVQELGLESLQLCRWYRKLCLFYKVFKNEHPKYLFNLIHVRSYHMLQELRAIFSLLRQSITFSKILFFHTLLSNGITDSNLRNSKSISVFKERILNFIRPSPIFFLFFDCHNPKRIKLITRLRLGLSHLRERKFKHSFSRHNKSFM